MHEHHDGHEQRRQRRAAELLRRQQWTRPPAGLLQISTTVRRLRRSASITAACVSSGISGRQVCSRQAGVAR